MASPAQLSLDASRSPADKKRYRVITLSNGLEALLIESGASVSARSERNSLSSMDETDADSTEDEETEQSNDKAPPLAAACLAVDVGSLMDPENVPGLAHYLEHMLFMGSEKYPDEDAFEVFLSAHGGSSNGATECETTRFLFDVDACYLQPALDMFASLFVAPLLRREAMDRELQAVESEFQKVRNNDPVRLQHVMSETSAAGHPYSRCFTWGNAESLKHRPERNGVDVREEMVAFFLQYYVASRMKLCVYGSESLDVLEQYVTDSFSAIPQCRAGYALPVARTLPAPYGSAAGQPPTLLRVVPAGDKRFLRLYWMLPAMLTNYRQKPWQYVAHLLGHEGPESTTSILKRHKWATDVVTGTSDRDAYEFGSFGAVFEVRVSLTEEGLQCWEQVAQVVFDALHAIRSMAAAEALPAWVFDELRAASEIHFQFQEDTKAPVTLCRGLSERMLARHSVVRTDLLRYDVVQEPFDAHLVRELLRWLSVDNVRVVLQSSSFRDELDAKELRAEQWFGTHYMVNTISSEALTAWSQAADESATRAALPTPNPFMPRDLSVLPSDRLAPSDVDTPPELVLTTASAQLWYKRDHTFLVPKASVSFLVTLPSSDAKTHMLAELHVELTRHRLQHTLEQADAANFDVELDVRDEAIEVVVLGFSDTLPQLVRVIMKEILCPAEFTSFEIASELALARVELERDYRNATLSPRAKAYELRLQMLESESISTSDKLEALQRKDHELARDLAHFAATILRRTEEMPVIRCLAVGNMNREAAVSLVYEIEAIKAGDTTPLTLEPDMELEPAVAPPVLAPRCHTLALPPTTNGLLVRRLSERVGERNSVVEVYFQIGKVGSEDRAYAILLRSLLAQPLFHELRTKQQLGYTVACSIRDTHGVLGLSVTVQSASHATGAVAKKLDTFLHEEFPRDFLLSETRLSPKRFATHVQTLQREFARPDSTLAEQCERYWEEVVSDRLEFDLDAQVAASLESCTRGGLLDRYQCWLQGSTSSCSACTDSTHVSKSQHLMDRGHGPRKLRVHVVGKCSPIKPLELLVPPDKTPQIITGDLHEFKRELRCHCYLGSTTGSHGAD